MSVNISPQYLAGVFDSDGSFSISKHRRHDTARGYDYRVFLQLTWTDNQRTREILAELKRQYGGCIYDGTRKSGYDNGRPSIKYHVTMRQSLKLLTAIIPFLNLKKEQASLCIEYGMGNRAGVFNAHRSRTNREWEYLDSLYLKIRALNSKNGKGHEGPGRFGISRPKRVFLTVDGIERSMDEWAKITGTPYYRILQRHLKQWTDKDAVFAPRYFRMRKGREEGSSR